MTPLLLAAAATLTAPGPALLDLRVTNGSTPYLGDGRLLTTVSPNRDGFRDAAFVHFRLLRPATVRLEVVATNMVRAGKRGLERERSTSERRRAGPRSTACSPTSGRA